MTEYEKQRVQEDLDSMLAYYSQPRTESTDDGNTRSNLLFGLLMLVLIAGPILVVMMAGGK